MTRRVGLALLAALVVLVAADGTAAPATAPDRQVDHRLAATRGDGARVVDDLGRTVLLRGVNVNGLGEYYQEHADLPSTLPLTADDLRQIAAHGFDVVRLIVSWSRLEPSPGVVDQAYLDRIAEVVGWARDADVYVLVDMHQDAWGPHVGTPDGVTCLPPLVPAVGWDGAPAWATALVGTAATCRLEIRELSVAVQQSFGAFYLDLGGVQSHLVTTWAAVASRFAADPAVAGYDLLNEPNPGTLPGVDDLVLLGAFYDRALAAIRDAEGARPGGFDHIGFVEPGVVAGQLPVPVPLPLGFTDDPNLVYAPHLYNESIGILPGSIEDGFASAAAAAGTYGTTFFAGEWGWFGDDATDQPKIERYAAAEDAHLVGGTWWQWEQACGDPHAIPARHVRPPCAGVRSESDGLVTRSDANVAVLERAYPRAAPGRLTGVDADVATGALVVTGEADRPGVPADLWVPDRCSAPTVAGTNVGPAGAQSVPGGARLTVPVPAAGDYRIEVTCGPAGPSSPGQELPATGGRVPLVAVPLLALGAVTLRRVSRRAR
jgi:endoglycosylceramidase